jgi:hypothetical protein
MPKILSKSFKLFEKIVNLMPSLYQRETMEVVLGLFLEARGKPLPTYSQIKSESAISRFFNKYNWSVRAVIREQRRAVKQALLSQKTIPRCILDAIIDLTTLEKTGKFKGLKGLIHILNKKCGLQVVVLYLVVGKWRVPWGFRIWRGKGTKSPAQLALALLRCLPKSFQQFYRIRVMVDAGITSQEFMAGIFSMGFDTIAAVRGDLLLENGQHFKTIKRRGQIVYIKGWEKPVYLSWFWLKRNGKRQKRYVISTKAIAGKRISKLGKRRWKIEGFFKTAKHRFGLDRFGQQTLLGVYRWLVLSLISFILTHWHYLENDNQQLLDWGKAAQDALEFLLPQLVVKQLLLEIERFQSLAQKIGRKIIVI